ncbi:facilitated trehalose transporter Tret1-like [Trichoplusia ni]|uniref:Facilitated trehalose transporter Tret1-like n=1 Tax=Trichoplusia ni TaxID=7111 RepID=A0A7E5WCY7_TRINI|nr:facilitated trehalose transporter Tret1-like [Trichoplusia ni]
MYIYTIKLISGNLTNFTYGLQTGWMSPMTKLLQSEYSPTGRSLTDTEISWIASAPCLAAVFGVLLFVQIVDRCGRKQGILLIILIQALTWIIKMLPPSTYSLVAARAASGLAGGGCFHVVPMYVKEIAQDNIRGTLASIFILAQSAGIVIMYAMGGYLNYYTILWVVIGIPIMAFGLFLRAPESPAYLVKIGKVDEAARTLAFLRGMNAEDKQIQCEIDIMKKDDDYYKSIPEISMVIILKNKVWRKSFIIMLVIIVGHATNGAFSILTYAATILSTSGVSMSPELQALSIPICMTVGCLITFVTIDRLGRKPILVTTFATSALGFCCIATTGILQQHGWTTPGWLNVVMLMLVVCSYGCGVSPIPFIAMSEIFNFQIRAKLMGYLVMLAWLMSFFQLLSFSAVTSNFGVNVSFYIFTAINLIGAVFAIIMLPETNGKSVEDIERKLKGDYS